MDKKPLRAIFVFYLLAWIVASVLPLLSVNARRLGVAPSVTGYYVASAYVFIAAGSLFGGWLSRRARRWRPWILAAAVCVPVGMALLIRATAVWQLVAATSLAWLGFGVMSTLCNALIGLQADQGDCGRIFGIIGITQGLGTLIGSAILGVSADRWGYPAMFGVAAGVGVLFALAGLPVRDVAPTRAMPTASLSPAPAPLGAAFWALFVATASVALAGFVSNLSRSLVMDEAGFSAGRISSTTAITGVVVMFVQPAVGWLSDRVNRRVVLVVAIAHATLAAWLLSSASALWHFGLASILMALVTAKGPVDRALTIDLLPRESLGRGMAWLGTAGWIGGIVGFAVAGLALEALGAQTALRLNAILPLAAIALLLAHRVAGRTAASS